MALYMVFIEDAEDRNGERCIMPTSEHLGVDRENGK